MVPSSLYGAFLAGEEHDARILIITFDASLYGWAAVLRTSPHEAGIEVMGGFRTAVDLLGSAFISTAALPDCPAAQVYRETLAGWQATQSAGKLFSLANHTFLIRSDCVGAIAALRKGSYRSPALQNVELLHNRMFMDVGAAPPLYLHVPGVKAGGVDDLSRSAARARLASESTAALRQIVTAEAERLGDLISLDLFATSDNTLVPWFFARYPEPLAEGADALAQLDWGQSRCPHCGRLHHECAYAFPPRGLLEAFVAKARSDGLRGVIVVPFAPSDSAWPTLAAASCTTVVGQRDPCVIVPSSRTYVCDGDYLGGAQRLAVMAVDFSRWSKRCFAAVVAPCGHHSELRAPQQRLGSRDVDEQRHLAEALLQLGRPGSGRKRTLDGRGW